MVGQQQAPDTGFLQSLDILGDFIDGANKGQFKFLTGLRVWLLLVVGTGGEDRG